MTDFVDVLIVGSSLAGSSLALRLAAQNISTVLVDKEFFPRRKACGEGLSGYGLQLLSELVSERELDSLPHRRFVGYRVHHENMDGEINFSSLQANTPTGLCIERYFLDHLLFQKAAASSSVQAFPGHKLHSIERRGDSVEVDLGGRRIKAKYVVLADGASSLLANKLGVSENSFCRGRSAVSLIAHATEPDDFSQVQVVLEDDFEACITPLPGRKFNIAALGDKSFSKRFSDPRFPDEITSRISRQLGVQMQFAGDMKAVGQIGRTRRSAYAANVFVVGDAVEQLDPIGGMGMTHALLSSKLAAQALSEILLAGVPDLSAMQSYAAQRESAVRPLRGFTRLSYFLLVKHRSNPMAPRIQHSSLSRAASCMVHGIRPSSFVVGLLSKALLNISGAL